LNVPSGHVFCLDRARGPVWYAKYRLPDGRQIQKKLGPAWSEWGRPSAGYVTERQAEEWLAETLHSARHGELTIQNETGVSFAEAAAEWLRCIEFDRERKPLDGQGLPLDPQPPARAGPRANAGEALSTELIDTWLAGLTGTAGSRQKAFVLLHGILKRARKKYGLAQRCGRR
jgi:hypothetical protein